MSQSSTSGLLCLAIFGGALLPLAVGTIADSFGLERILRGAARRLCLHRAASRLRRASQRQPANPRIEPPASASPIP